MNLEQLIPYIIQIVLAVCGFMFVLGKYKVMFDHHEKILKQHEKQLDKQEQAIDGLIQKINAINTEFTFMKGWLSGKNL